MYIWFIFTKKYFGKRYDLAFKFNNDNTISFHFTPLKAATGINNLSADHEQPAETYTLSGVKVADNQNLHNQIVIVNGKKVRK